MKWIKAYPEKAREMARNANKILQEKFALENILLNIEKMHNRIKAQSNKWDLQQIFSLSFKII